MKFLLLMLLSLTAFAVKNPEPKFYKGQKITYETGFFLHKVCSGKGTIDRVGPGTSEGSYVYDINTPNSESECPKIYDKEESKIKAAE